MYPTYLFHPVHAPEGQIFTEDSVYAEALADGWVDSPAKLPPPPPLTPDLEGQVGPVPPPGSATRLKGWRRKRDEAEVTA